MAFLAAPVASGLIDREILLWCFMGIRMDEPIRVTILPFKSDFTRSFPFTFVKN